MKYEIENKVQSVFFLLNFVNDEVNSHRYPITLFNELYYLNAGSTIWTGM